MAYVDPVERGALETSRFLTRALPKPPCHVLEVGCGSGAVAQRLAQGGFAVTGLDVEPESVSTARQRGVEAVEGDVLTYHGGPFDAVVFTRSFHHMDALPTVVDRIHGMVKPGGRVVLEEFAMERMDLDTARWFYETLSLLEAAGLIAADTEHEAPAASQLDRWFGEHENGDTIHTGEDMMMALGARFDIEDARTAPYLYRYVSERLEPTPHSPRVANWVFEVESMRIAQMTLKPIGLRVVACRR